MRSAFDSAGQRCSAARVLFVQEDSAQKMIDMLVGAVETLDIGDPFDYATDIGPVIDEESQDRLEGHKIRMQREARELVDLTLPEHCRAGTYVTPAVYEIDARDRPRARGVRAHPARRALSARPSRQGDLDAQRHRALASRWVCTAASRAWPTTSPSHARVGNLYVNRNQIGAVVGVQPFGGEGLSGTGPKAGGPHYARPLCAERVRTTDITATGGNLQLLSGAVTES